MKIPPPPGRLIFAEAAPAYASEMRRIFRTRARGSNHVMVTLDGARVWVVLVPDLTVIFTGLGQGNIAVNPLLATIDQTTAWPPPDFAQPAIDATQEFLLQIAPVARPQ